MNKSQLKKLAFWGKFLGWSILISGCINTFFGIFAFLIGAIPGLISIFVGWKLITASKQAEKLYLNQDDEVALNELISNYLLFFKIQGILIIVSLIAFFVFFSIAGIGVFSGLSSFIGN